jgi:hypothetical protein
MAQAGAAATTDGQCCLESGESVAGEWRVVENGDRRVPERREW